MIIRLFTILFLTFISSASAGPLKDIHNDVKNMGYRTDFNLQNEKWFKDHPNLRNLFMEKNGGQFIFAWVGEGSQDFFRQENFYTKKVNEKEPFITFKGIYLNKQREKLTIKIFIPHPKIASTIELGLNSTINNLVPPHIPVFFEKKIRIKGLEGKLYLHKSNACSIILNLPSSGILRTYKKECSKNSDELQKFTEGFDLERLKLKLTKPAKNEL